MPSISIRPALPTDFGGTCSNDSFVTLPQILQARSSESFIGIFFRKRITLQGNCASGELEVLFPRESWPL